MSENATPPTVDTLAAVADHLRGQASVTLPPPAGAEVLFARLLVHRAVEILMARWRGEASKHDARMGNGLDWAADRYAAFLLRQMFDNHSFAAAVALRDGENDPLVQRLLRDPRAGDFVT